MQDTACQYFPSLVPAPARMSAPRSAASRRPGHPGPPARARALRTSGCASTQRPATDSPRRWRAHLGPPRRRDATRRIPAVPRCANCPTDARELVGRGCAPPLSAATAGREALRIGGAELPQARAAGNSVKRERPCRARALAPWQAQVRRCGALLDARAQRSGVDSPRWWGRGSGRHLYPPRRRDAGRRRSAVPSFPQARVAGLRRARTTVSRQGVGARLSPQRARARPQRSGVESPRWWGPGFWPPPLSAATAGREAAEIGGAGRAATPGR
jgi:hypothetical protein